MARNRATLPAKGPLPSLLPHPSASLLAALESGHLLRAKCANAATGGACVRRSVAMGRALWLLVLIFRSA